MALNLATRVVTRTTGAPAQVQAEVAVLGAGIGGLSAALESARLGRRVVLIDGAPSLGGQAVNALIGTFCGLFSNGPDPHRVTYGIADALLADLGRSGGLHYLRGRRNTVIVQYDETLLGRWIDEAVREAGIDLLLGAVLQSVRRRHGRIEALLLVTRYGEIEVRAGGFVDASGDAALAYSAGLACREPVRAIFGTQMLILEGIDEVALQRLDRAELHRCLAERGTGHGLVRHDGFAFAFPGKGTALVNMTHLPTPLDALAASRLQLEGRAQADRLVGLLRMAFPAAFAGARVRSYGLPGIRQTRWIVGRHQLTAQEVRRGVRFADAVGRCSWPIELHDHATGVHWEEFGDRHMHWIPFGCMLPQAADNLLAVGRCVDGDPAALSSIRVMGPCIAMGAAAAHALDLVGAGSLQQIDVSALQARLADNLERADPLPDQAGARPR